MKNCCHPNSNNKRSKSDCRFITPHTKPTCRDCIFKINRVNRVKGLRIPKEQIPMKGC